MLIIHLKIEQKNVFLLEGGRERGGGGELVKKDGLLIINRGGD